MSRVFELNLLNRFRSGAEKTPYYPSLINEKEI